MTAPKEKDMVIAPYVKDMVIAPEVKDVVNTKAIEHGYGYCYHWQSHCYHVGATLVY